MNKMKTELAKNTVASCQHDPKDYYGLSSFPQYKYCTKCGDKL